MPRFEIPIKSNSRIEMIDITGKIREVVRDSGVEDGICILYVPHTTASLAINENADPSVRGDIVTTLSKLIPLSGTYSHSEGNADAHIKSTLLGCTTTLIVEKGDLLLGTWQGIFFCEFDGPRTRRIIVKVIPD
jgi:secondary thiamine-phosphate synthase enzyme